MKIKYILSALILISLQISAYARAAFRLAKDVWNDDIKGDDA